MESFLVQVWVPADDTSPDADLRGVVRHLGTGVQTRFRGDIEVLRLLRRRPVDDESEVGRRPDCERETEP